MTAHPLITETVVKLRRARMMQEAVSFAIQTRDPSTIADLQLLHQRGEQIIARLVGCLEMMMADEKYAPTTTEH